MALTKVQICNMALSKIGNERNQLTDATFSNNTGSIFNQCDLHYEQTLKELVRMHSWNCCKARSEIGVYKINFAVGSTISSQSGFSGNLIASTPDSNGRPTFTTGTSGQNGYVSLTYDNTNDRWSLTMGYNGGNVAVGTLSTTSFSPVGDYNSGSTAATGVTLTAVKPTFGYDYSFKVPDNLLRCLYVSNTDDAYQYAKPNVEWEIEKDSLLSNDNRIFICYDKLPEPEDMDALFAEVFYTMLAGKLAVPVAGNQDLKDSLIQEFYSVVLPEARRVNGFEQNNYAVNDSEWLEATYTTTSSSNSYPPFSQTNYNSIP